MSTKLGKTVSSKVFLINYLENTNALEEKVPQEEILISSYLEALKVAVTTVTAETQLMTSCVSSCDQAQEMKNAFVKK